MNIKSVAEHCLDEMYECIDDLVNEWSNFVEDYGFDKELDNETYGALRIAVRTYVEGIREEQLQSEIDHIDSLMV